MTRPGFVASDHGISWITPSEVSIIKNSGFHVVYSFLIMDFLPLTQRLPGSQEVFQIQYNNTFKCPYLHSTTSNKTIYVLLLHYNETMRPCILRGSL